MRTLTLNIDEKIYEKVKTLLSLFSPDKVQIVHDNKAKDNFIEETYLNSTEVEKMNIFLKKRNVSALEAKDRIPLAYNVDDLDSDLDDPRRLDLLK